MTDYSDWKILKTDLSEKQEEYTTVAKWCNESQQYHIELYINENNIEWYRVVKNPEPIPLTNEEIKQLRTSAYIVEVDPITAHIQRLKDQNPQPEEEIAQLIIERDAKFIEIQERYPYNEEINE